MSSPSSIEMDLPNELLSTNSALLFEYGTILLLKMKVNPVITNANNKDGKIIRYTEIPIALNAFNSLLEESLLYVNKEANKVAIGNDKTIKLGNLRTKIFNAVFNGKSSSTILRTRSNITPTDTDTTVKAEIEKTKGGINCERIHLSSRGI